MGVRKVEPGDVAQLARVLAEAFYDDPAIRWLWPDPARRRRTLATNYELWLGVVYQPKGYCYTTDELDGAAMWAPPGAWRWTLAQQARLALPYLRILGPRMIPRAARIQAAMGRVHPAAPHWYLAALGIAPARQRQGVGRALLEPVLDCADATRTCCYLETHVEDNVGYYERFGFKLRSAANAPRGGPMMWSMWREPG